MNIGIVMGAFWCVLAWLVATCTPTADKSRVWAAIAGLLMGYASRLAFGCNVGAFFSNINR